TAARTAAASAVTWGPMPSPGKTAMVARPATSVVWPGTRTGVPTTLRRRRRDHPRLPGVGEEPARGDHGARVAERAEPVDRARVGVGQRARLEVEHGLVVGAERIHQPGRRLARVELAGGDAVAEEDARERPRHHGLQTRDAGR